MNGTASRLLRLLSLLQTGRERAGSDLAAELEVSQRTVRRDIERLRSLGYPVHASLGAAGGYRLVAGAAMPPLLLDDEEAIAIAVGLRVGAGYALGGVEASSVRALAKVLLVLPAPLRRKADAIGRSTTVAHLGGGAPPVDADLLVTIASAISSDERLRLGYVDSSGRSGERRVDPWGLVCAVGRWYLVGFDIDRDDWRMFRVDRVQAAAAAGGQAPPRPFPASTPGEYVQVRMLDAAPTVAATALAHASAGAVAARLGDGAVEIEVIDDSTCRLRLGADTLDWLALRLMRLGCEFEVEGPTEFVEHLRQVGARFTRATS